MVSLSLLRIGDKKGKLCLSSAQRGQQGEARRGEAARCPLSTLFPLLAQKPFRRNGRAPAAAEPVRRRPSLQALGHLFHASGWEAGVCSLAGSWGRMALYPKCQTTEGQSVFFGTVIQVTQKGNRERGVWVL